MLWHALESMSGVLETELQIPVVVVVMQVLPKHIEVNTLPKTFGVLWIYSLATATATATVQHSNTALMYLNLKSTARKWMTTTVRVNKTYDKLLVASGICICICVESPPDLWQLARHAQTSFLHSQKGSTFAAALADEKRSLTMIYVCCPFYKNYL